MGCYLCHPRKDENDFTVLEQKPVREGEIENEKHESNSVTSKELQAKSTRDEEVKYHNESVIINQNPPSVNVSRKNSHLNVDGHVSNNEPIASVPIMPEKHMDHSGEKQNNIKLNGGDAKHSKEKLNIDAKNFIGEKSGVIKDNYDIMEVLGKGAFGEVRKTRHKLTGDIRAMKIIKKDRMRSIMTENLFNEVEILKTLDHPNIVKLYEFYQDDKSYYLITEYCQGGELFDRIVSIKYFTENLAAEIMRQILSSIVYCHHRKIAHRDLKPENLLLVSSDMDSVDIKVIDFGTSRHFEPNKKMDQKFGTPYYIAPEVLKKDYNEKCDVWSCGVILYILLCGYPPFAGRSDEIILDKVSKGIYNFDGPEWPKISQEAKSLVKKMLTYDPAARISSDEALNDPWIQNLSKRNSIARPLAIDALNNLRGFNSEQKLQAAVLTYIASQLSSSQEKDRLKNIFMSFDKNNDGQLSRDELIIGYTELLGNKDLAEVEVDAILAKVDTNKNGFVDYTEFIAANINTNEAISRDKLQAAFNLFDLDGNGEITIDEIKKVFAGDEQNDEGVWRELIEEVDEDGDGMISFEEFKNMMMKFYLNSQ